MHRGFYAEGNSDEEFENERDERYTERYTHIFEYYRRYLIAVKERSSHIALKYFAYPFYVTFDDTEKRIVVKPVQSEHSVDFFLFYRTVQQLRLEFIGYIVDGHRSYESVYYYGHAE